MPSRECLTTVTPIFPDCLSEANKALRREILAKIFPPEESQFIPNITLDDVPLTMTVCLLSPSEQAAFGLSHNNDGSSRSYVALGTDAQNHLRLACRLPDFIREDYRSDPVNSNRHEERINFGILYLAVMGFIEPVSEVLRNDIRHVKEQLGAQP